MIQIFLFLWKLGLTLIRLIRLLLGSIYKFFVEISPIGFSGGIWLLCKSSIDFNINILNRFIHCQITENKKGIHWLATFLYGYPHYHLQKYLWKESSLNTSGLETWIIIGDLNELSNPHETMANHKANSTWYNKLQKILNENCLLLIGHIGLSYT